MPVPRLCCLLLSAICVAPLLAQSVPAADSDRTKLLEQRREILKKKWEARFRAADTDGDRLLTREEATRAALPAAILDHFDEIDTDHDGRLSPEELVAAYEKRLDAQKPVAEPES